MADVIATSAIISNIYNLKMEHMTFHIQFRKCHTIMSAYHVTCGKVK